MNINHRKRNLQKLLLVKTWREFDSALMYLITPTRFDDK